MRTFSTIIFAALLAACSGTTDDTEDTGCADDNPCPTGQTCEAGACVDDNSGTDPSDDTDPTDTPDPTDPDAPAPTTDATWPASSADYTSSHLTLITSLELSAESEGNKFGDLLRFLAGQADISVEGYFVEYLASGAMVSLVDHQAIASTSDPQAFLLSHLGGNWAAEATWESMQAGTGSVSLDDSNFTAESSTPNGAYESASLISGALTGANGHLHLDIPEGNILTSIDVHDSQLSASEVSLSSDSISYAAHVSGYIAIAEFYESLNRAFENLCGCAGIEADQDVWTQTAPGVYECDPNIYDSAGCVGTDNEALCNGALPLCSTLTFVIRGDLDMDPDVPDEDAMSVMLEIETTPVTLIAAEPETSTDDTDDTDGTDGADGTD